VIVINLSGRGDKDLETYIKWGNYWFTIDDFWFTTSYGPQSSNPIVDWFWLMAQRYSPPRKS
jgi:hypothetical protein